MFSITVALANTQIVWTLLYKTKAVADSAWRGLLELHSNLKQDAGVCDEFGQMVMLPVGAIAGVLFEDLDQSKMAHIERAMHTERVKIQAQNAAQSDPIIKNAMRTAQRGPAIFDPTMQNGGGPPRF